MPAAMNRRGDRNASPLPVRPPFQSSVAGVAVTLIHTRSFAGWQAAPLCRRVPGIPRKGSSPDGGFAAGRLGLSPYCAPIRRTVPKVGVCRLAPPHPGTD